MRPIHELRAALRQVSEYGPEDPDRMALSAALDELESARAQIERLKRALRNARACWLYETSQGDGVLEDHVPILAEVDAALSDTNREGT